MARIARVVIPKYPHHVTQRGSNRMDIFKDNEDRFYFLKLVKKSVKDHNVDIWAYCLMSNHFHLLIEPNSVESLGKAIHFITFLYAQHYNRKYQRSGRLWENRYFSCPVDKDEYVWAAAKYIETNPIRAKLIKMADKWEWSSATAHIHNIPDRFIDLKDWLKEQKREYKEYILEEEKIEEIRRTTRTGRLCGKIAFYNRIEKLLGRELKVKRKGRPRKGEIK